MRRCPRHAVEALPVLMVLPSSVRLLIGCSPASALVKTIVRNLCDPPSSEASCLGHCASTLGIEAIAATECHPSSSPKNQNQHISAPFERDLGHEYLL